MSNASTPQLSVGELLEKYRTGALSPQKHVEDLFGGIEAHGDCSVFIHLRPLDDILTDVKKLAELPRKPTESLPLFGIPFAVKDNIDCAGLPTTAACPAFTYTPKEDAFIVSKLKNSGAILVGKTNLDQFATGLVGTRSPYGIPKNTFSSDHIPGGSSSGSAVAVAAGHVAFSLGTDTAGSGRVPAAFNNIVGLKPSCGRVSTRGVVPACRSIDCPSIFAMSVEEAMRVFEVLDIFDVDDPYARRFETEAEFPHAPAIGVLNEDALSLLTPDYRSSYRAILDSLRPTDWHLTEIDFTPFLAAGRLLYEGAFVAERLTAVRSMMENGPQKMDETVFRIIAGGQDKTALGLFDDVHELAVLRRRAEIVMQGVDALLLPTAPCHPTLREVEADKVGVNTRLGTFTNFVNLLDFAAIAIPGGFTHSNMPFGVTLAARSGKDRAIAALASALLSALDTSMEKQANHGG